MEALLSQFLGRPSGDVLPWAGGVRSAPGAACTGLRIGVIADILYYFDRKDG
jgi:hypothetical protein